MPSTYINKLFWIIIFACLSFIPTLFIPHVGEEGVYTISSQEMLAANYYWQPLLYGNPYSRPPLFNWLIIAVTKLVGTTQVLLAARIVTSLSILSMAILTGLLTWRLLNNKLFSLLAVAIFLSGDLLLRRGWLAYSDPIFACFTFASMALLWLAVQEHKYRWLLLASLAAVLGYLSKVHTVFVFYGLTAGILFWHIPSSRNMLFNWRSILIHSAALVATALWAKYNGTGSFSGTAANSLPMLQISSIYSYIKKLLLFPWQLIALTMPVSIILLIWPLLKQNYKYFLSTNNSASPNPSISHSTVINTISAGDSNDHPLKTSPSAVTTVKIFKISAFILLINLLPYWLAPRYHARYLLPLYPFMAMVMAYLISYIIYRAEQRLLSLIIKLLWLAIIIKFIVAMVWYPYDQTVRKGNAAEVAAKILAITQQHQLFVNNDQSAGLRVAAEINRLRPQALLRSPPEKRGAANFAGNESYLLSYTKEFPNYNLVATFNLGSDKLFLLKGET